jgi:hypothetical protein
MDIRLLVAVVAAAASAWLLIVIIRKVLDAIDKATDGVFYKKGWVKKTGIVLDTLLPILPCVPSGGLALLIMSFWPPDALWNNSLLYFCIGALAGVVAAQIYQTITRGLEKYAERIVAKTPTDPPTS